MARRSKDDGAAVVILIIGGVIFAALAAFLSIVVIFGQYLFSAGFLICLLAASRKPKIKSAQELCSHDEVTKISALRANLVGVVNKTDETLAGGDRAKLPRRSNDPNRFDERKPLAKRTNALLDRLEEDYVRIVDEIDTFSATVQQRYDEWSSAARRWKFWYSGSEAFVAGFGVYLLVLGIFQFVHPMWLDAVSEFVFKYSFLNAPSAPGGFGPKIVGFLIATPVTLLVWPIRWADLEVPLAGEDDFLAIWSSGSTEAAFEDNGPEQSESISDADDEPSPEAPEAPAQPQPWWAILGVSRGASVNQIKAAYRAQIKQYHPDKVADLGPKLREVAEEETRLLNAAYEEGLKSAEA